MMGGILEVKNKEKNIMS